ncbi:MAG: RNA polymerase sigma factor [Bacteroidetes bacterium]|nr:RNA polymerase sigma factor [Bacteroidota bacterium]
MNVSEYNKCVDEFSDGLYRFMLKSTKSEDIAKDLVQDSYEKLWIKHEQINVSKAKIYLFTIAYHLFIDFTRAEKRLMNLKSEPIELLQKPNFDNNLKNVLNIALEKLPEIQKTLVLLRDYEGYHYDEIAKITNLNESQVKVYIFRARQSLKKILIEMEVEV